MSRQKVDPKGSSRKEGRSPFYGEDRQGRRQRRISGSKSDRCNRRQFQVSLVVKYTRSSISTTVPSPQAVHLLCSVALATRRFPSTKVEADTRLNESGRSCTVQISSGFVLFGSLLVGSACEFGHRYTTTGARDRVLCFYLCLCWILRLSCRPK